MKKYMLFLLLLIALQNSKAQSDHFKFDHFTVKDGLPSKNGSPDINVSFIQQDDLGYLWLGTDDGLIRFDGYNMHVYHLGNEKDKAVNNYGLRSMLIDENKNLWFTAGSDLFKYNRLTDSFTQYKYPKSKGNVFIFPYLSLADSKGNLWEEAFVLNMTNLKDNHDELVKFDQNTKTYGFFGEYRDIFKSKTTGHRIWLGTNNGLFLYNDKEGKFDPFNLAADTAKQKSVYAIYEAPSEPGILWLSILDHFSKQRRIERFDIRNKTYKDYSHLTNPALTAANDTISNIFEDSKRRLWFGTSNGLLLFNRHTETFTNYAPADTDKKKHKNQINFIAEAKNGRLWMACGKGILNFDPETRQFQRLRASAGNPDALGSDDVNYLMIDHSGALWVSLNGKGLNKLNPVTSAFTTLTKKDNDPNHYLENGIETIKSASDGYAWFATDKGIFKWRPGTDQFTKIYAAKKEDADVRTTTTENGITTTSETRSRYFILAAGKDSTLYFSNQKGLQVYNPVNRQQQSYIFDPHNNYSINSNAVSKIILDHSGMVWVATDKGLCKFDPATHQFTRYAVDSKDQRKDNKGKLIDKTIRTVYEDRQGTIWIGTINGELCRLDQKTGRFKIYLWNGNKRTDLINELYESREGRFWVGTGNEGLLEFDRKQGSYTNRIDEDKGLLYGNVTGICEDDKGFLWLNSAIGLSRLNQAEMSVKTFPFSTALPGNQGGFENENLVSVNGWLVIGLDDGVVAFDPLELDNPEPPFVHIETFGYSDPVSRSDSITTRRVYNFNKIELPYNQNRVTFSYVALHFTEPGQNRYAYTLEGYDNRWIQAGALRSATYTNLSPGTYTFRVRAANSDGVWNNTGDNFILIIDSPWWQKWWAWLVYVILFAAAIYAFVYYRSRQLMKDKRLLEEQVQIRTEEVLHQKEEIETQRDNLESQRNTLEKTVIDLKTTQAHLVQSEKMASLGELTAGIAHEIQNPLNFVNNFSDINREMICELKDELKGGNVPAALAIADDIEQNEEKINHHGKRADSIVKGMLEHSRSRSGQKEPTNINVMADEYMRLSYHGLRAKDKSFNSELTTHFDPALPKINVVQQDIGRVLLNLFNNAFYAVNQKAKTAGPDYKPEVTVSTSLASGYVIIKVMDNGVGIPDAIKEKIMQPFFTTKPTGEGTGLGLSLTYDMVVKGHGGKIDINSVMRQGAEFIVSLPII
ncbi:MAG TPA: two-component regulator propeller domain-containing protein [Mucilaginibacter sp.]|jgi:signal transduction histidine kinase/ligand-binding sensor domain-containing protein|nr:two-component regulator propeller domain-containing protein [Mucilaginibacter sp.]